VKLYLVVIQDKDLAGEPDIGLAIIEGNELDAHLKRQEMERACIAAGRCRCVGRVREIERGYSYRATSLLRTNQLNTGR
jgi:hypothetical protein